MAQHPGGGSRYGRRHMVLGLVMACTWHKILERQRDSIRVLTDLPDPVVALLERLNLTERVAKRLEEAELSRAAADLVALPAQELLDQGATVKHPLVLVPGIISCGLELWRPGECFGGDFFRERLWGGVGMARTLLHNVRCWLDHLSLDPDTGLDREGQAVRVAEGFQAADYFAPRYWLWSKLLENAALLGYDRQSMYLACYDWRLSFRNLERRDSYFTRLKSEVEFLHARTGEKVVLLGHSMGASVAFFFLDLQTDDWCAEHVHAFVSLGGSLLGAAGPLAAAVSGEMAATAALGPLNKVIDSQLTFLNKTQQRDVYRSLGGIGALLPKGADVVWGDDLFQIDDNGTLLHSRGVDWVTRRLAENPKSMRMMDYDLHPRLPKKEQKGLATASENPLNTALPKAPRVTWHCLYGRGIPTERAYRYLRQQGDDDDDDNLADFGYIDYNWSDDSFTRGVSYADGDGTVPLLSLGYACAGLWRHLPAFNPSGARVVLREYNDDQCPVWVDPRGGPRTSRHVEILGNAEVIADVLRIATAHDQQPERIYSEILKESVALSRKLAEHLKTPLRIRDPPPNSALPSLSFEPDLYLSVPN